MAGLYLAQGRYGEAEPLYRRALAIDEKALGPDHPELATNLNGLALLYRGQGRYGEAEPLLRRALAIDEKALGPDHPNFARSLNNLALLYQRQGRYGEAERLFERTLAIAEPILGPDHPHVATTVRTLARLYRVQDRYGDALRLLRRASTIHRTRAASGIGQRSGGALSEQRRVRPVFLEHAWLAMEMAGREQGQRDALVREAFEAAQLARATDTAAALGRMAARFGAGGDALARRVRARQDAIDRWRQADQLLIKAVGRPPDQRDPETEARLRAVLARLDRLLSDLDQQLAQDFPAYHELESPQPVSSAEAQDLLAADEALLAYFVAGDRTFLWAVRRDRTEAYRLNIGQKDLASAVADLRAALDPTQQTISQVGPFPPFDLPRAFDLYTRLVAPAEPLLDGVRHLLVVPDGALASLPPGVLVTADAGPASSDLAALRRVPWLARDYAVTVLPAVSSLRALRRFARPTRATEPFVGIGDPLLGGHPASDRRVDLARLFTPRGAVDVETLRGLPSLPESADELATIARALGADAGRALLLRERATEAAVRAADLSPYRVVAFATHAAVAGELTGLAEPALVLTPPEVASEADDGLLTASEVAQLDLNADWVILSACNTAAADGTPGAEALSGLAKAFFYAGSRALLVSHWPVFSDAAVELTTGAFAAAAADPTIGRAEALRRAMVALMEDPEKFYFGHPRSWAPFVVVGEGGAPVGAAGPALRPARASPCRRSLRPEPPRARRRHRTRSRPRGSSR